MLLPFGKAGRLRLEQLEDRSVPSRPLPYPVIFAGTGSGPAAVRAFAAETGDQLFERAAFERFSGGVHVAAADFTKDGFPDAVVAAGPGGGPHVRVLDGKTGEQVPGPIGSFFAYDGRFRGGVSVAAADVDGDTIPDVITAAGAGGGPHVKVFSGATGAELHSFFALEPGFRGGASIAAADFTGDGKAEVVVGAGRGGGPRVRVLDLTTGGPVAGPHGDFFALDPVGRTGVSVGTDALTGDVNADGVPDLVIGSGPGGPARVVVYSGKDGTTLADFRPFGGELVTGVRVATAFVDDDPFADVVVGTGPGVAATVRVFSGKTFEQLPGRVGEFRPFGDGELGGVFVGASNDPPSYALPESAADAYAVVHDKVLLAGGQTGLPSLLGNDRDRDNDPLTARLVGPSEGKPAPQGTVTVAADGSFTYTPPAKFVGEDTFWYVAKDAVAEGTPVPVTVSVVQHNPVPLSDADQFLSGTKHYGTVGMWDGDGDPLTVTMVEPLNPAVVLAADGSYSYDPGSSGPLADHFKYQVADSLETGPVGVRYLYGVVAQPVVPAALGGAVWSAHDRVATGTVKVSPNGLPCGEEGCYTTEVYVTTPTQNGSIALDKVTHKYTYTPNAGFVGLDWFAYQAKTGPYTSPPAPWYLQVVERRPVARADSFVTGQTTPLTKSAAPNDDDGDNDALTFEVVSDPTGGTLSFQTNGTFTYTPNASFVGVDKFTYRVWDGLVWTPATTAYVSVFEAPGSSIGDQVWFDENMDGKQDATEQGIAGVTVALLQYDYASGIYTQTGPPTTTLSGGWYSFNNLYSGKYKLQFTNPNTSLYFFTYPDRPGVSDSADSDAHPDTTEGKTGTTKEEITLAPWTSVMTVDCGMSPLINADIDIASVQDDELKEDNPGGYVVMRDSSNNAPRSKIVLQKVNEWDGNLKLTRGTTDPFAGIVRVFTAAAGGQEITFNGTDNIFNNANLPTNLYVQGDWMSSSMRDVPLKLEPVIVRQAEKGQSDSVSYTVLYVIMSIKVTGTVSNENLQKDNYKAATTTNPKTYNLGYQKYNYLNDILYGYGFEVRGTVFPSDFQYPNVLDPVIQQDVQARYYTNDVADANPWNFSQTIPNGNDPLGNFPDHNPTDSGGYIFNLDMPGFYEQVFPVNTTRRLRFNVKAFAVATVEGVRVRASDIATGYVRFSIKQNENDGSGSGKTWVQINDIAGDNTAAVGEFTPITWNLQP